MHVARALHHDGVADAHVQARRSSSALCSAFRHDAADRDPLSWRPASAQVPPTSISISRTTVVAFSAGKLRQLPARVRDTKPTRYLPIEAVDLVDDAVNVVVERAALGLDFMMKREQFFTEPHRFISGSVLNPARRNQSSMPDCVSAGSSLISPHA